VHSRIWKKLGVDAGAAIEVALRFDAESREPIVPEDLTAALADAPPALRVFRGLTTNLRAEVVRWVAAAKRGSTREKRLALCVRRMHERAARSPADSKARKQKSSNRRSASQNTHPSQEQGRVGHPKSWNRDAKPKSKAPQRRTARPEKKKPRRIAARG
jgi:hypothetical protein